MKMHFFVFEEGFELKNLMGSCRLDIAGSDWYP